MMKAFLLGLMALAGTTARADFECQARAILPGYIYVGQGTTEAEAKVQALKECRDERGPLARCYIAGCQELPAPPSPDEVITDDGVHHGLGLKHKPAEMKGLGEQHTTYADCENLPDNFDLRDAGTVSSVKDQGQCGSCWAFSQTQSLESATLAAGGPSLNLSEQELVSCDHAQWGCNGGLLNGFKYQIDHGQGLEKDFPYTARDSACKSIAPVAKGLDYAMVGQAGRTATPTELRCAMFKSKTVPWITVSAGGGNWNSPPTSDNGVFTSCRAGQTNHAVGVVGWVTIGGKIYFKMKNSWGTVWGSTAAHPGTERGYALLPLGCNSFGDEIGYITVKAGPGPQPPAPPHVKLPAIVQISAGDGVLLGLKAAEAGVAYQWYAQDAAIPGETGPQFYAFPTADTVFKLVGKNAAGTTESSVKVTIITAE